MGPDPCSGRHLVDTGAVRLALRLALRLATQQTSAIREIRTRRVQKRRDQVIVEMCETVRQKVVPHLHEFAQHERAALASHQDQTMAGVDGSEHGVRGGAVDSAEPEATPVSQGPVRRGPVYPRQQGGGQAGGSGGRTSSASSYQEVLGLMDMLQEKVELMSKITLKDEETGQPGVNLTSAVPQRGKPARPKNVDWLTVRESNIPRADRGTPTTNIQMIEMLQEAQDDAKEAYQTAYQEYGAMFQVLESKIGRQYAQDWQIQGIVPKASELRGRGAKSKSRSPQPPESESEADDDEKQPKPRASRSQPPEDFGMSDYSGGEAVNRSLTQCLTGVSRPFGRYLTDTGSHTEKCPRNSSRCLQKHTMCQAQGPPQTNHPERGLTSRKRFWRCRRRWRVLVGGNP